jgi:hypothetical protein
MLKQAGTWELRREEGECETDKQRCEAQRRCGKHAGRQAGKASVCGFVIQPVSQTD